MPIYEYRCKSCSNDFEALILNQTDEREVGCPKCRCTEVERILSPFSTSGGEGGDPFKSNCGPSTGGFS